MIYYPEDDAVTAESKKHDIPRVVLVRDLVRTVEILNLKSKDFFRRKSVLAGSMALRCFGSPRFTVYDADLSTSSKVVSPPTHMKQLLKYEDEDLEIAPSDLTPHNERGTAWVSDPVHFTPVFTSLVPDTKDRQFKVDVSFRGLICDGIEKEYVVPYRLNLWTNSPTIHVMDPHEIIAEKVLGWCKFKLVKHYADLAFIALASQRNITLNNRKVRETLDGKLSIMKELQPDLYEVFPDVEALVDGLVNPRFDRDQWLELVYVRSHRDRFTQQLIRRAVEELLIPMFRARV